MPLYAEGPLITHWRFTEGDVFRDVLHHALALGVEEIEVRLHPSDDPDVYAALARQRPDVPCRISASETVPLVEAVTEAGVVVGVDTYALYVAYQLGVPAVSIVPGGGRECTVPLPDANRARTLGDVSVDHLQRPPRLCADAELSMDFASLMELIARASSAHEDGA